MDLHGFIDFSSMVSVETEPQLPRREIRRQVRKIELGPELALRCRCWGNPAPSVVGKFHENSELAMEVYTWEYPRIPLSDTSKLHIAGSKSDTTSPLSHSNPLLHGLLAVNHPYSIQNHIFFSLVGWLNQ